MNRKNFIFGILGALGVLAFIAVTIVSLVMHGSFSVLNSFVGELGKYPGSYLGTSIALLFNIALAASGLLMTTFFVGYGLDKTSLLDTASSFFGILTGVLIAAQGVFTLNMASTHYLFTTVLFASAFIAGVLYIFSAFLSKGSGKPSLAGILTAFAAASVSAVFAVFVQAGNMPYILGVEYQSRISVIPFAIIEWAALVLIFAFTGLLAVKMILGSIGKNTDNPPKTKDKPDSVKVSKPIFSFKKKNQDRNIDF